MTDPCVPPCNAPVPFLAYLDQWDAEFVLGAIEERGCSLDGFIREALINHAMA